VSPNPYLDGVPAGWWARLRIVLVLLGGLVLGIGGIAFGSWLSEEFDDAESWTLFFVFGGIAVLLAGVLLGVIPQLVGQTRIREAAGVLSFDRARALDRARSGLRLGAINMPRAWGLLVVGTGAEDAGDFGAAEEVLAQGIKQIPWGYASLGAGGAPFAQTPPQVARELHLRRAFCLATQGRTVEAHDALTRAHSYAPHPALRWLETRAWAMLFARDPGRLLDLLDRERAQTETQTPTRDRALLYALEYAARAGDGLFRSGAAPGGLDPALRAWIVRAAPHVESVLPAG
jgi:hypothetical protein